MEPNDGYARQIREMVARDRRAQGLPERIEDPIALRNLAALIAFDGLPLAHAAHSSQRLIVNSRDADTPRHDPDEAGGRGRRLFGREGQSVAPQNGSVANGNRSRGRDTRREVGTSS